MSRKNNSYTNEFKLEIVQAYLMSEDSYDTVAKKLGLRNSMQLKNWVKKFKEVKSIEAFTFTRMPSTGSGVKGVKNPLKGKRIYFKERDYYKAQIEYLKKQYSNL